MPASLSQLTAQTVTTPIALGDDPEAVTVTYRTYAYDRSVERVMREATEKNAPAEAVVNIFLRVIQAWDLRLGPDDPEPLPLTEDGLDAVPTELLTEIVRLVGEHRNPNPPTGNGSQPR